MSNKVYADGRKTPDAAIYFCIGPYHQVWTSGIRGLQKTLPPCRHAAAVMPRGRVSRLVMSRDVEYLRQNVGIVADSEGMLPNALTRKRTVQHQSGAPGWNRTSDTRFRKPVLYPLSYEGIVPICRGFSTPGARQEYQSCQEVAKSAGNARSVGMGWNPVRSAGAGYLARSGFDGGHTSSKLRPMRYEF